MPAGGNSRVRGYPARMSERQQLALLLQMTSQEMTSGSSGARSDGSIPLSNTRSSLLQQQKSSKSRWSNKNADLLDVSTSYSRQEERLRLVNGCDSKDRNEFAGSTSPDEVRTASGAESPVAAGSPAECAATVISTQRQQQQQQQHHHHYNLQACKDQDNVSSSRSTSQQLEHEDEVSGASYEMRRTPPQNKVERQATGGGSSSTHQQQQAGGNSGGTNANSSGSNSSNSSNSPRVTLRLNQVRATRDDKKGSVGIASTSGSSTASPTTGTNAPTSSSSRQSSGSSVSMSTSQMEASSTKSSSNSNGCISTSSTSAICTSSGPVSSQGAANNTAGSAGVNNNSSSSSSVDGGDVYEFKSSKEATPVRGSSSSPNPNPEKDAKDANSSSLASSTNTTTQSQNVSGNTAAVAPNVTSSNSSSIVGSTTSSSSTAAPISSGGNALGSSNPLSAAGTSGTLSEALSVSGVTTMNDEPMLITSPASTGSATSTSTKRAFESEAGQGDDQDEEGRKRKKKDTTESSNKEVNVAKGAISNRQTANRNNSGATDKCAKSGKQPAGAMSAKSNQNCTVAANAERKSPSASLSANSPKPSNPSGSLTSNISKVATPASTESDGEDERSKNTDCNSTAPKVPPLKIVIPQSTTSEQEQGNRNGKNTSNRSHQLPYVVASSNSNDSMDKDQSMSATTGGTTSPLDSGLVSKSDDKKDFSGALDNESRSTHHQRVLRSSHRSGNGSNGTNSGRESSANISGNGNYSNSSPLPTSAADRSNNSSPQQRHQSPIPESSGVSEVGKSASTDSTIQNSPAAKSNNSTEKNEKSVDVKKEANDSSESNVKKENSNEISNSSTQNAPVELHPRKRKMKSSKEAQQAAAAAAAASATSANETTETTSSGPEIHPHDQPITNCYQLFLNIRKQIERRRKGLFPVQPKPPQGFKDYLMNRCTYVLAGNANKEPNINPPVNLMAPMKDLYVEQEKERYRLRMQHVVEKEKLVLSVEQEILRVHGRAARALANQSLPFSVCTILKDEEVYNVITPEQEEKDRNARSRYNGRLFLSWLQDVDDKWEKIKEAMLLRHHNEAESLHAVQRMDWEWKLKEVGLCEFKATPQIEDLHVPMVHVSDDFDLLPA